MLAFFGLCTCVESNCVSCQLRNWILWVNVDNFREVYDWKTNVHLGEQLETFSPLMNKKTPDLPLRWLILIVRASVHMFIYVHCQHISTHPCKTCATLSMIKNERPFETNMISLIILLGIDVYFHQQKSSRKTSWFLVPFISYLPGGLDGWTLEPVQHIKGPRKPMGLDYRDISQRNINQQPWLQSILVVDIFPPKKKTWPMGHTLYWSNTPPKFQSQKHHPFFPPPPQKKTCEAFKLCKKKPVPPLHLFMFFV